MAKLTDKNSFIGTLQSTDLIHVVDVNDLSQSPAGSSYKLTLAQLNAFLVSGVTLQQVLTNGNSTGGLSIKSPDNSSILTVKNGETNLFVTSGTAQGGIIINPYNNSFGYTDGTVVGTLIQNNQNNKLYHDVKNTLQAPINEVSQNATTALGIVTKQQLQAYALTSGSTAGGDLSGTYPNPAVLNSAVLAKLLTGYLSGSGTVSATDSILQAIQKLNGNDALKATTTYVDAQDAITLASANNYTDNLATGLSWKKSVLYSTTTGENLTLTGLTATIDGTSRTLLATDRILVKNQTTQTLNGLYNPNAGAWTRVVDANSNTSILSATVYVRDGNLEKNRVYAVNVTPITIGTTNITFALINGAGAYTYGAYLKLTGNVFDIDFTTFTTAQITDSTNKRYQTDSQQTNNDATSSIQTQLNAKAPLASPTLTGTPIAPTATVGTNTTQLATTAFVLANSSTGGLTLQNYNNNFLLMGA